MHMKNKVIGLHLDITDGLNNSIQNEIEKIKGLCNKDSSITVELSVQKKTKICHISLRYKDKKIDVTKANKDMYVAIQDAFYTLKNSLVKNKDKTVSNKHKNSIKSEIRISVHDREYDPEEYPDEEQYDLEKFENGQEQYPD